MSFILTEEQESIRKIARDFGLERLPVSHMRTLRDERDASGFSRAIWQELGELGLIGVALPEELGGTGLGYAELGLVLEEFGRTLAPTPYLSTAVLAAEALRAGGSVALREAELPGVCSGSRILSLAHDEGRHHAPYDVATRAQSSADGFVLDGTKSQVLDGHVADAFIVVARSRGACGERDGLSLFWVPRDSSGVTVQRLIAVDGRNVSRVTLKGVRVGESALLGTEHQGAEILDRVLDAGMLCLAAEMLGAAQQAFDITIAYLLERKQFGVLIGSFQALKHRAAKVFCEIELSKSVVMAGLRALDEPGAEVAVLASAAKARLNDTFLLAAAEGVQMHGGVGVTDEYDIGLYYKRARVAGMQLGTSAFHRDRFARLHGY